MSPIDFDELVEAYEDLDEEDLKTHYLAAKQALLRKLGVTPRTLE